MNKSDLHLRGLRLTSTIAILAVPLCSTVALAAGGGGEGDHHAHVANWFNPVGEINKHAPALGWVMFTFAVFLGALSKWVWPAIKKVTEDRHDAVKSAIEEAKRAKQEAEATKREYDERLGKLDDEIAELRREFETRGKAEIERLEAAGARAAERILKDAEDTIAAEVARAEQDLKAEAARLALEIAEERIRKAVTDADEDRLRQGFLNQLGAS